MLKKVLETLDLVEICLNKQIDGKCDDMCEKCECNFDTEELEKQYKAATEECWQTLRKAWKQGIIRL